jgi:hypothetical protein
MSKEHVSEAVGIFSCLEDLQSAIDELLSSSFHRADLSLLASEQVFNDKIGGSYKSVSALADDPSAPRTAYVSPEAIGDAQGGLIAGLLAVGAMASAGGVVAAGGTLAAAIGATMLAGGTGAFIGSILARLVGDHHARYLKQQMDHGGLLLWVRTWDAEDEKRAAGILRKHSGAAVHVHTLLSAVP